MLIPEAKFIRDGIQFSADHVDRMETYLPKVKEQLRKIDALPKNELGVDVTTQEEISEVFVNGFVLGLIVACQMVVNNETPEHIMGYE